MPYNLLLKNHDYCLLQSANFVNRLGDSVDAIALSWLIYSLSQSPAIAAINFAVNYLPNVLLQPFMGALITNKRKKNIMVLADLARGIIVCFLGMMVLQGKATPFIIMGCTFTMSCFETLRLPASSSILPLLIDKEEYSLGVSFSTSLSKITELVGTGVAGFIIGLFGMHMAIFLDALSFMISSFLIFMMKINEQINADVKQSRFVENFIFGIKYALENKALLFIAIIAALANMILVPFNALQSAFVSSYYHGGAMFLSVMGIAISSGSIIGGLIYPKLNKLIKIKQTLLMIFPTSAFYYLALLASGSIANLYLLIASIAIINFITGVVVGIASCNVSVVLMLKTKQEYLSRISGFFNAISQMFIPALSLFIGFISKHLDVSTIFLFSAIIILIIAFMAYSSKKMEILND